MSVPSTTLAELKANAAPPMRPGDDATEIGFYNGPAFALAQRVSTVFAQSTLVPKAYQGNVGNCLIALNMAQRLGCDPLMAMQNLYVVHGTPAWSAQFLIATFNKCGRFSALRYEFQGQEGKDNWGCRAVATELATGEKLVGPLVTIDLAKKEGWHSKSGSKWQTMPEQMLRYRAAAWFVRAYAPEIAMGLHMAEEVIDAKPNEYGVFETAAITTDDIKAEVIEAEATPGIPAQTETPPAPEPPADDQPAVTQKTREAIDKELARIGGTGGYLPPELASAFGTGDPSELDETQGREAVKFLKGLK